MIPESSTLPTRECACVRVCVESGYLDNNNLSVAGQCCTVTWIIIITVARQCCKVTGIIITVARQCCKVTGIIITVARHCCPFIFSVDLWSSRLLNVGENQPTEGNDSRL